jgi:acetate kinase
VEAIRCGIWPARKPALLARHISIFDKVGMNILIFNCGSSSQSFKVYRASEGQPAQVVATGKAKNVATRTQAQPRIDWAILGQSGSWTGALPSHRQAAEGILEILKEQMVQIDAVGHRFVHGGELFEHTTRIDGGVLEKLRACFSLAPIHNPNSYSVIEVCLDRLADIPQFVVFDTAFHAGLPEEARRYAIPRELAEKHGYRKYGFHGLSYQYVSAQMATLLGKPLETLKLILCHLGTGGSSVTAFQDGHSIDTSMGFSPLPGLVMSTRCGDIDAEIVLDLVRGGITVEEVDAILNNRSGLIGLTGFSSNLEEIIEAGEAGNRECQTAFEVYAHRLRTYLGAYSWLLNGADAIVFTDDVGLKSWKLREKVCSGAENLGVALDRAANRNADPGRAARISTPASRTQIWIVPTDEEVVIMEEVAKEFSGSN